MLDELYFLSEATKQVNPRSSEIINNVYPVVAKHYTQNKSAIKKVIANYISSKYEVMYATTPYDRIAFNDFDNFWKALNLKESVVDALMSNCFFHNLPSYNPRAAKSPFVATMICCIKAALKDKDDKMAELLTIYLDFSGQFYPSIHAGCWKYLPNREVLEYVVNNKLSNKFDLKKYGNVFSVVRNICIVWLNTYKKDINSQFEDNTYGIIIQQLHDRTKSFLKNIAKVYYDNKDNYMNYVRDNMDPENYILKDTNSSLADKYTDVSINYMTTRDVDYKFCQMVADENVKKDEIKSIMSSIFHNKDNIADLRELVNIIIINFMRQYPDEPISSVKFLTYSMSTKPNSKDKDVMRIREIIIKFLNENSVDYVRRKSRQPTATSYYKAVLKMICLCINAANK